MTDADRPSPDPSADAPRALLASTDWASTPLGPIEGWPKALRGYAEMVLAMPTPAILFWGPEQTQIYNDGYALILGPRHPRGFGQAYRESWPDTYPLIHPWMRHVLDTGGTWRVDRTHIPLTRHGFDEEAYFTFTFSALRDDDGQIAGILQPVFEVTDSVLADRRAETLRRLRPEQASTGSPLDEALATLGHNAGDLPFVHGWLWDAQGMDLVPARHVGEALAPADNALLDAVARSVWAEGAPRFVDVAAVESGGLTRSALLLPLEGAAGAMARGVIALGVSRRLHFDEGYRQFLDLVARQLSDSLQRVDAARAAERQRQYLNDLFMALPAGIAVLGGPDHRYELANPAYLAFIGDRRIIGTPFADALPELEGQDFVRRLDDVYRTGIPYVASEVPVDLQKGPDGRLEPGIFDIVYQPLRDERGLTTGILNFAYEVTQEVNARRDMERLADELRAEHRRKDDFLAMLAHELRNPLAPIAAAAEVLRLGQAGDPRLRRTGEIVTRQVRHMATLIDDLLDASRVTRGIVSVERRDVDLRDVVAYAVEQVTPQAEGRRHQLRVAVPADAVRVAGDRKRLVQVLTNLLDNAIKYTPEGGLIEVTLARDATDARLVVRDNGAGVSPELRERIFDLFVQGQRSADRAQGGLGIGLALARSLVELHGGGLACRSAGVDQGSEFEMRLPLVSASLHDAEGAPAPTAGATPSALGILVVDDNEDALHMLAMLLESAGHEVMTETDPVIALERAQATRPDVFILDIGLPRMDGHELARRLRASPAGACAMLIALTGYGQAADREAATQAGFDHYLVKPVDPAALERLLATASRREGPGISVARGGDA